MVEASKVPPVLDEPVAAFSAAEVKELSKLMRVSKKTK
jgi:ABC-type sugar transport system ATPase subunit